MSDLLNRMLALAVWLELPISPPSTARPAAPSPSYGSRQIGIETALLRRGQVYVI